MQGREHALGRVEIDGLEIAYQRVGDGHPVVFLHGFFGDHRVWRDQLELADDWTVVAWDAPGCGGSTQPPATFTIADYADTLAEFIAELGLDRPHLVGNSFGGALALELAARHPTIPASLVVNGGSAGWSGSFPPEVVAERLRQSLEALDLPAEEVVSRWVPQFVTSSAAEPVVSELSTIISDVRRDGMRVMMRAYAEADLRPELARVTAPTLLIWGEEDRPRAAAGRGGPPRDDRRVEVDRHSGGWSPHRGRGARALQRRGSRVHRVDRLGKLGRVVAGPRLDALRRSSRHRRRG